MDVLHEEMKTIRAYIENFDHDSQSVLSTSYESSEQKVLDSRRCAIILSLCVILQRVSASFV